MKKAISLFLCFVILLSLFPTAVFAEGENGAQTEAEIGDVSYSAENSLGTLLMRTLENEESDTSFPAVITDLSIDGTTASVELTTDRETDVVVAIYPDSETDIRMLGSGYTSCGAGRDVISMEIEIDEMPKYFIAAAYLLDAETHETLSEQFISRYYTSEFQAFLATTTDDYDADLVLNLDDDTTTNFLVFSESTLRLSQTRGANELTDNGNDTYTIRNADEKFRALQPGDSFAYTFGDGSLLLVVAASVQVDGNTVTITADPDACLDKIFDYVKIDGDNGNGEGEIDMSSADPGVHCVVVNPSKRNIDVSVGTSFEFEIEQSDTEAPPEGIPQKVKGKLVFNVGATVKIYKSGSWYSAMKKLDYSAELGIELTYSAEHKILLGEPKIPLGASGLTLCFPLNFVVKADGTLKISAELKGTIGISFDSDSGYTNLTSAPSLKPKAELLGKVYIGFDLSVKLEHVVKKLLDVSLTVNLGFEVMGTMKGREFEQVSEAKKHECLRCLEGSVSEVSTISIKFKALFDILNYNQPLWKNKNKLFDYYNSEDYNEHGLGTCPHISYKVNVTTVDENGTPLPNTKLSCPQFEQDVFTNDKGKAEVYLPNGNYTISASSGELSGSTSITVYIEKKTIQIVLKKQQGSGRIVDQGYCGENMEWTLYENGTLIISGTGNMENWHWDEFQAEFWGGNGYVGWQRYSDRIIAVEIKSGVTSIGENAFTWSHNLANVMISDSVTSIGRNAFESCSQLKGIIIPNSVTRIGSYAFWASGLTSVTIPSSVTNIEEGAFCACRSLTTITIPDSITRIEPWTFAFCEKLISVSLPNKVTSIGNAAFHDCYSMTSIIIPNSVASISTSAFAECDSLKDVYYTGTEAQWKAIRIEDLSGTNSPLLNATIHYNSSGPIVVASIGTTGAELRTEKNAYESSFTELWTTAQKNVSFEPLAAFSGATELNSELCLAHFSGLVAGASYVMLVTADAQAERLLTGVNLLYIAQGVADESGCLTLGYIPHSNTDGAVTLYGLSPRNLADAVIQVDQLIGGFFQVTVRYQGVELTEGTDYKLTITEEGEMVTVSVIGRDAYTGKQTVEGTRLCAVIFDANGGEEAPRPQAATYGGDIVLTDSVPVRENCVFLGWTEEPEAEAAYHAGDTLTPESELTLYAVWLDLSTFDCILPDALKTIEAEAFFGCAFRCVRLPDNAESIGKYAFAESETLEYIYIPECVTDIAPDAFDKVEGLTIIGVSGSTAEDFATQYGFSFIEG